PPVSTAIHRCESLAEARYHVQVVAHRYRDRLCTRRPTARTKTFADHHDGARHGGPLLPERPGHDRGTTHTRAQRVVGEPVAAAIVNASTKRRGAERSWFWPVINARDHARLVPSAPPQAYQERPRALTWLRLPDSPDSGSRPGLQSPHRAAQPAL